MTEVLTGTFADCATGEVVVRPLTAEELAAHKASIAAYEANQAEMKAEAERLENLKASALAKLAALGLTEEEAKAIAG